MNQHVQRKPYRIFTTKGFRRDTKRLGKAGYDMGKLQEVVDLLASGHALPEKYKNHSLQGEWIGYEDCHIEPDWVLIYQKRKDLLILTLTRSGTHAQLFKQ